MGIEGFRLTYEPLNTEGSIPKTAVRFNDTIGIGQYFYADIHRMDAADCPFPSYLPPQAAPVLPYYLPFRALTHAEAPNLLVAGKSMAMTFWANAPTRLHPEEVITGVAAGAAATLMAEQKWSSAQMYAQVEQLQSLLQSDKIKSPLYWTLSEEGKE